MRTWAGLSLIGLGNLIVQWFTPDPVADALRGLMASPNVADLTGMTLVLNIALVLWLASGYVLLVLGGTGTFLSYGRR